MRRIFFLLVFLGFSVFYLTTEKFFSRLPFHTTVWDALFSYNQLGFALFLGVYFSLPFIVAIPFSLHFYESNNSNLLSQLFFQFFFSFITANVLSFITIFMFLIYVLPGYSLGLFLMGPFLIIFLNVIHFLVFKSYYQIIFKHETLKFYLSIFLGIIVLLATLFIILIITVVSTYSVCESPFRFISNPPLCTIENAYNKNEVSLCFQLSSAYSKSKSNCVKALAVKNNMNFCDMLVQDMDDCSYLEREIFLKEYCNKTYIIREDPCPKGTICQNGACVLKSNSSPAVIKQ